MGIIGDERLKQAWDTYLNQVFDYLEFLGYDHYVVGFNADDVAKSLGPAILELWLLGVSYRMNALIQFSMTWNYQIVRQAKSQTKH